ncbi:endonuclease NucS domain-containing protein [Bacillus cereus group sp. BfR-BA-01328]|uniref:endonuclease NucS domain-containing protein n=1 Tax=Bacillus cereus group sp. BfR-BA-01328 TaxID=2920304 RepID=UPI001F55C051
MNYYEDEIALLLKEELSIMYGISNFDVLYRYLVLRFKCESIDDKKKKEEFIYKKNFIQFILNELHIEVKKDKVSYKGEFISINPIIGSCFANAIEDWCFSSTFYPVITEEGVSQDVSTYLSNLEKDLVKRAKKRNRKYKKESDYWYRVKHEYLMLLNELFQVQVSSPNRIKGFVCVDDRVPIETLESRYMQMFIPDIQYSSNVELITEAMLEEYMKRNLSLVENGLKLIATQYMLPKGRIDILAKDSNGVYVVIELKVEEDTDIVWQSLYYRNEIKRIKNVNEVRFITIMPKCEKHIFDSLRFVGGVEIFEYIPVIKNEQLIKVQFKKKSTGTTNVTNVA